MFSSIIGHQDLKESFLQLVNNKQPGTYLFYGPPSVGKRTVSFEISKKILCLEQGEDNCSCKSCKIFNKDHPDFICIGRSERITVKRVDEILEVTFLAPLLSNYKIIILDNYDNISIEASNRLLKTLEEPPETVLFFLITSKTDFILPTILSRCIKTKFNSLNRQDLINILWKNMGIDPVKAQVLSWIGYGTDIFSYTSQYLQYRDHAIQFLSDFKRKDPTDILNYVDILGRKELGIFSEMLLLLLNDIIFMKNNIDIINADQEDLIKKLLLQFDERGLLATINMVSQIKKDSYLNINMSMTTKNTLLKMYYLLGNAK